MDNQTEVKTMEVKDRRKGDVRVVVHDKLLVDDGVDPALPVVLQEEIRRRCGVDLEHEESK